MQLVERGMLDLDEPASHYSSDFKTMRRARGARVTHLQWAEHGESLRANRLP